MKRTNLCIYSLVFGFALMVLFAGCAKNKGEHLHTASDAEEEAAEEAEDIKQVQTWHVSSNRAVVLFGYGYNDKAFVERTLETLYEKYGAAEDGGLIIALVFPDGFKKDAIASELPIYASREGTTLRGVLLLGAPENTNYGIARLQDYYGGERSFPVFSLFPQDDVLGTEATSDFVLERVQETNVTGGEEENSQVFVPEIEGMIERSIEYFCFLSSMTSYPWEASTQEAEDKGNASGSRAGDTASRSGGERVMFTSAVSLPWDESLLLHVQNIAFPLEVSRYVDGETGLQSVNHFVIEDKNNTTQ